MLWLAGCLTHFICPEIFHELRLNEEFREIPVEVIERRVIHEKNNTVEANKNFDRR